MSTFIQQLSSLQFDVPINVYFSVKDKHRKPSHFCIGSRSLSCYLCGELLVLANFIITVNLRFGKRKQTLDLAYATMRGKIDFSKGNPPLRTYATPILELLYRFAPTLLSLLALCFLSSVRFLLLLMFLFLFLLLFALHPTAPCDSSSPYS